MRLGRAARRSATLTAVVVLGCSTPTGRFTREEAARVCFGLAACLPQEFASGGLGYTLDSCTSALYGPGGLPLPGGLEDVPMIAMGMEAPMKTLYRCVLDGGTDCGAVRRCLYQKAGIPNACFADAWLGNSTCTNAQLTGCTREAVPYLIDCDSPDLQCSTTGIINGSFLGCSLGACSNLSQFSCDGNVAPVCVAGSGAAIARFDCERFGRRCESPRGGTAYCAGGNSCRASLRGCDGQVAVSCGEDGHEFRWDCARNPTYQRCVDGLCAETGSECKTDAEPSFCDGDQVGFCQDGRRVRYDCVALGFAGCNSGLCVPP